MTDIAPAPPSDDDLTAASIEWNLDDLVDGDGVQGVDAIMDEASEIATNIAAAKGTLADLDASGLASLMRLVESFHETVTRAASYAQLRFAVDTSDGALFQKVQEAAAQLSTQILFVDLEWAALSDERVDELLADEALDFCAHHLRGERRYKDHLLSEAEEALLTEKSVTGASAWSRLFSQLTSEISVDLPTDDGDGTRAASLEESLSLLAAPDADVRSGAAAAVSAALQPGLSTRAYVFNTLLQDKAVTDRLRGYPTWVSSRNLSNEATDDSVQALVDAVVGRYDIPQRWYRLKSEILGHELFDHDRMASVAESESRIGWNEASSLVLGAYESFSPELATVAREFFDNDWIDAPMRPSKRPGAFCSYTVPSAHPYLFLNWTGRSRDVMTLAHELGHGCHASMSRPKGIFHFMTPLTLAETASVFGETLTFQSLFEQTTDPSERLALLAENIEGSIATVFRQTAMNRFEDRVHTERRTAGELSPDRFGDLWIETQSAMLGDSVTLTDGYRDWWSYIPHFMATPGYVYAYAYGQLLALSVYRQYELQGSDFVSRYLSMLSSGGSLPPEELGRIVGCDLADPGFWTSGLELVERQLEQAEQAWFEVKAER